MIARDIESQLPHRDKNGAPSCADHRARGGRGIGLADHKWWLAFDVVHHAQLVRAYRNSDVATAKRLVYQHRDQVKGVVRRHITDAGGEV